MKNTLSEVKIQCVDLRANQTLQKEKSVTSSYRNVNPNTEKIYPKRNRENRLENNEQSIHELQDNIKLSNMYNLNPRSRGIWGMDKNV